MKLLRKQRSVRTEDQQGHDKNVSSEKIYVYHLDGVFVWIPIEAKRINGDRFQILVDEEYELFRNEPWMVYEFYPGDIVELGEQKFDNGETQSVAKKLLSKGNWPERQLNEFKFRATIGNLDIDRDTALKYRDEIQRILSDHSSGQFYYPALIETSQKLNDLL